MDNLQSVIQIDYKKSKKAIVPYLTEKQMKLLLAQPDGNTWQLFRDKVMLAVLYDTGARVQELCDLRIKDVRLESPAVITLTGKGNKVRQVPIMSGTQKLLKIYLEKHKGNAGISRGDNPLFVNQRGQKLSRWGVSHIIDKYVDMAKEKGLMTPVKDAKFETVYSAFNNVPKERVISPAYLGIKDALSVQVRIAAFKVGKGQMTIDEAVAKYGSLTE